VTINVFCAALNLVSGAPGAAFPAPPWQISGLYGRPCGLQKLTRNTCGQMFWQGLYVQGADFRSSFLAQDNISISSPEKSHLLPPATYFYSSMISIMTPPHKTYDITIVGAGPAGLLLSVCLSRWGYKVRHVDNRAVPTATGRADGIQPRSLEILKNMGLKRNIMAHNPAKVFEVAFWDPQSGGKIIRTGTSASCPDFLESRYPFTALLHQGLIERVFLSDLHQNGTEVGRPWTIVRFENNGKDAEYPVEVDLKNLNSNVVETVKTKYLFSGEGARSSIRKQLGIDFRYKDPISYIWGVMDGVVRTDFPDIKMKCTIHSDHGSIMIIPRENNMVRLYIQIESSSDDHEDSDAYKTASVEEIQIAAKNILQPYQIEWDWVEWFSVYPISQGIAENYTLDQRVFMGGDACHTHSPKAGQGMNTAFHDAVNLAWKLHHVESGFASRSILDSYQEERKHIAEMLLKFDNEYAALFSQHGHSVQDVVINGQPVQQADDSKHRFVELFKASCEFTSGYGVAYEPNVFTWSCEHVAQHPLFNPASSKVRPGRIIPPANVRRVVDANVVHLENEIPLNGAFRLFVFGGTKHTTSIENSALYAFAIALSQPRSCYSRFIRNHDPDASNGTYDHYKKARPRSRFISICLVLALPRCEIEISDLPELFQAHRDYIYADDMRDPTVPEGNAAAHAKVGLFEGGAVVVRPDGHVGCVVSLGSGEDAVEALEKYFGAFMIKNEES
jgi:2-polyprenyl-6-methoxyphenol hydroxylase-like FAD-dependent oxidoreductase